MKTVTYTLRIGSDVFKRVEREARSRKLSLAAVFRESISHGLGALPPPTDMHDAVADTWNKLGPAPEIDYGKL